MKNQGQRIKSTKTTFTLRKGSCPPVQINHINIPLKEQVKFLGLTFDCKLNWRQYIIKKRKQMDHKTKKLNWLIGKKSYLSIDNKSLIYKTVIKPIWTYGIELWGCASKTNIAIIQRAKIQNIRSITNAPWYVSNLTLHKDLKTPLRYRNYQRKQHQVLQQTRKPLQPTSSTTTTTSRKSQTPKKLASRLKELDVYPLTSRRVYN
jgi:hypothetical protein